jgi:hypothetical protein
VAVLRVQLAAETPLGAEQARTWGPADQRLDLEELLLRDTMGEPRM